LLFGFIPDTAVHILNILLDNTFLSAQSHIAEIRIAPIMKLITVYLKLFGMDHNLSVQLRPMHG